jgi:alkylhydroperoxidase family enzyme
MTRKRTRRNHTFTTTEIPNAPALLDALARSPAALAGYLGFQGGLARSRFSAAERALIGLMVAQRCASAYWLSVQAKRAREAGLTTEQIAVAREGCAGSERARALLFLAGRAVLNHGALSEADLAAIRQAGLSDADTVEAVVEVGLNLTAAFVSHAARLQLDFPPAPPLPAY